MIIIVNPTKMLKMSSILDHFLDARRRHILRPLNQRIGLCPKYKAIKLLFILRIVFQYIDDASADIHHMVETKKIMRSSSILDHFLDVRRRHILRSLNQCIGVYLFNMVQYIFSLYGFSYSCILMMLALTVITRSRRKRS
jgi:hypothetical protein